MIGAGVSGIMMGYKLQKLCPDVEFKIYEKNDTIGGTWLENRYPGCGCDIPSHAYAFPWAPNVSQPYFKYSWQRLTFDTNSRTGPDSSRTLPISGSIWTRCAKYSISERK